MKSLEKQEISEIVNEIKSQEVTSDSFHLCFVRNGAKTEIRIPLFLTRIVLSSIKSILGIELSKIELNEATEASGRLHDGL